MGQQVLKELWQQVRTIDVSVTEDARVRVIADLAERQANLYRGSGALHCEVNVSALHMLISLREDRDTGNCYDLNLMRADHFFQTRTFVSLLGKADAPLQRASTYGYEATKGLFYAILGTPYILKSKCETSLPGQGGVAWANKGIEKGAEDFAEDRQNKSAQLDAKIAEYRKTLNIK